MSEGLNTRCTAALRALEGAGVICRVFTKGHSLVDDSGATAVVVELGPRWQEEYEFWKPQNEGAIGGGLAAFRPGYGLTALNGWLHDLSDPVTAASLIVLVREAWGDPEARCVFLFTGEWVVIDGKGNAVRLPKAPTEVGALVAALEAKVREVRDDAA